MISHDEQGSVLAVNPVLHNPTSLSTLLTPFALPFDVSSPLTAYECPVCRKLACTGLLRQEASRLWIMLWIKIARERTRFRQKMYGSLDQRDERSVMA
eukprot:6631829-Prymnesium_polylepis.1